VTTTRSFARYIALPAVTAGILGGAALGFAGLANADTDSRGPQPRPGQVATTNTADTPGLVVHRNDSYPGGHGFVIDIPAAEFTPTTCSSHAPSPVSNHSAVSMPRSARR